MLHKSKMTEETYSKDKLYQDITELNFLDEGSVGVVYVGSYNGKKCAIKELTANRVSSDEKNILSRVDHPNIIKFYEERSDEKYHLFIFENAEFGNLRNYILKNGVTTNEAKNIIIQIISGLLYCHNNGIIHRDIKLDNILITSKRPFVCKLCDFGLSAITDKLETWSDYEFCGSPEYLPPEIASRKRYDYQIDLWSLGVVVYGLLTNQFPFSTYKDVIETDLSFPPDKYISENAKDFISGFLKRNPSERMSLKSALEHSFLKDS